MAARRGRASQGQRWKTFEYDFARQGGTVGAKTLTKVGGGVQKLPDNAVILGYYVEPVTSLASAGSATVALGSDDSGLGAAALKAATAFDNAMYAAATQTLDKASLASKVNKAGGTSLLATIAAAALTAGKFRVHVKYREGV